jgi:quercetin dioxygenase-like cupin family protein
LKVHGYDCVLAGCGLRTESIRSKEMRVTLAASIVLLASSCLIAPGLWAQQGGVTRTELKKIEFPGSQYVTESILVTVAPQGSIPRHTHPGVEMGYLISGEGTLSIDGEAERTIKTGDSWAIPSGKPHSAHNTGNQPLQLIATYVVEKDKPLGTPAP